LLGGEEAGGNDLKSDTFPADITDAELLAYIEGDADGQIVELVERSEALSLRVQQLRREVEWLTAHSFRRTCPGADDLGDFYLGLLPKAKARAIKEHLTRCPFCSRELVQYKVFLGDPPKQPGLVKRIVVSLARLLDSALPPGQALAPAYALRGEAKVMLYQAGDLQISLDVQEDIEKLGYWSIVGIVTGPETHLLSVDLWQEDAHLNTVPVDETGGFTLPALLPGVYELIVKGADVIIHIPSFSL
jgi:hypothetical protein